MSNPAYEKYQEELAKIGKAGWRHPFEETNLGLPPYTYLGMDEAGQAGFGTNPMFTRAPVAGVSACDHCGTVIRYQFWFRSSDGHKFKIGSDCYFKAERNPVTMIDRRTAAQVKKDYAAHVGAVRKKRLAVNYEELIAWYDHSDAQEVLNQVGHPNQSRADRGESYASMVNWYLDHAGKATSVKTLKDALKLYEQVTGHEAVIPREQIGTPRTGGRISRGFHQVKEVEPWWPREWPLHDHRHPEDRREAFVLRRLDDRQGRPFAYVAVRSILDDGHTLMVSLSGPRHEEVRQQLRALGGQWWAPATEWQVKVQDMATIERIVALLDHYEQVREKDDRIPVPTGRHDVEAEILKVDERESQYGIEIKMTVKCKSPLGTWMAWGTQPAALHSTDRGDLVAFSADFQPSDRDPTFGFFKRPTRVRIIRSGSQGGDEHEEPGYTESHMRHDRDR